MFACVAASNSPARASARWVARRASSWIRESELSSCSSSRALLRERGLRLLQRRAKLGDLRGERRSVGLRSLHLLGGAVEVSLTLGQPLLQQLDPVVGRLELGSRAFEVDGSRLRFRSRGLQVGTCGCHACAGLVRARGGGRHTGRELLLGVGELRGVTCLGLGHLSLELLTDRTDLLFELCLALDELRSM